ncbi:MAG: hypothetical protein HC794_07535, partial [Nitrospiraceae bacterium]|nr:hypothetical protein [Nitrospiraceae bacterium]
LLDFIEGLRGLCTILLISQRPILTSDLQLELTGLSIADLPQLWLTSGQVLTPQTAQQLYTYTGGNPRLLNLLLALQLNTGEEAFVPEPRDQTPSLVPAFQRIWQRLTNNERRVLQQLSVYQGGVPEDIIPTETRSTLIRLRLVDPHHFARAMLVSI